MKLQRHRIYCHDCHFLEPKEKDQTDKKESHFCHLLGVRLKHEGHHPHIPKHPMCRKEEVIAEFKKDLLDCIERNKSHYPNGDMTSFVEVYLELPGDFSDEDCI
jgi:hypothetical protein